MSSSLISSIATGLIATYCSLGASKTVFFFWFSCFSSYLAYWAFLSLDRDFLFQESCEEEEEYFLLPLPSFPLFNFFNRFSCSSLINSSLVSYFVGPRGRDVSPSLSMEYIRFLSVSLFLSRESSLLFLSLSLCFLSLSRSRLLDLESSLLLRWFLSSSLSLSLLWWSLDLERFL